MYGNFTCTVAPKGGGKLTPASVAVVLAFFLLLLQYGEFRTGFKGDKEDTRMVVWGLRYILENYVIRQWTVEDVERADVFYRCAGIAAVCMV
jgi:hypothetical protein